MAFKEQQEPFRVRTRFDIDNQADLAEIKYFEKELAPFFQKTVVLFGKALTGFDLYLHENDMLRYSHKYPQGAVVFDNLGMYRTSVMKFSALSILWDRKKRAELKEVERIQTLIPATV